MVLEKEQEHQESFLHSDVCGPFEKSQKGYGYYILFKYDFSRFGYVYFKKKKSEVEIHLKTVLAEIQVAGHRANEFLTDNRGEFLSQQEKKTTNEYGIRYQLTMPYSPRQNGCAERVNNLKLVDH